MRYKIIFFVVVICSNLSFITGCHKNSNACHWAAEPPSFFFQIKDNGKVLPDSVLNSLKMYYTKNSVKKYINDLTQAVDFYANKGIMTTREIGMLGTENYILEYDNGSMNDTIYADYSDETPATNCQYILRRIRFNGSIVVADTTFGYQPVYVFTK